MAGVPSGPAGADPAAVAAVDQDDVERVLGHLPLQLQPRTPPERVRYELYVRQRIALGRDAAWLVEAAASCMGIPRTSPLALWAAHVDRAWDERATTTRDPRPARPQWCGECDERTRLLELDDDRVVRCSVCHPRGFGAFVGAS